MEQGGEAGVQEEVQGPTRMELYRDSSSMSLLCYRVEVNIFLNDTSANCTNIHIHTYIHTYIYTYTHTHTHTRIATKVHSVSLGFLHPRLPQLSFYRLHSFPLHTDL